MIPVTGIWEPWTIELEAKVRCPNYYLVGDTASQYQMEGSDTLEDVRWRLIWKDSRYASGDIPTEEADYFLSVPEVVPSPMLAAYPGDTCPISGEWFSNHLNQKVQVKAGESMPGPELSQAGNKVIWYLKI